MSEESTTTVHETAPPAVLVPKTDFTTGELVRLKSGGPIMTLGTVLPSHTLNTQVECRWFVEAKPQDQWFYLGQLEVVSDEAAKAQLFKEAEERSAEAGRKHELEKLRLQESILSKQSPSK